jgi:hypothetical protein
LSLDDEWNILQDAPVPSAAQWLIERVAAQLDALRSP